MEYNTTRTKLLMPEYGRNVQKMIEYLVTVPDREKRLQQAEIIIELMGTLSPHLKTIEDYKHKLWDHLYQMTDFSLDVDSPYPCPAPEEVFRKPERLPYPQSPVKHRHLGKNLQGLLDKAVNETNDDKRFGLTQAIGYYMKLAYANWHKEPVHDDLVKGELAEITGGRLKYEPSGFKSPLPFDNRPGFKPRNPGNSTAPNNGPRNFKPGGAPQPQNGNSRNPNFRDGQRDIQRDGPRDGQRDLQRDGQNAPGGFGGNNNYNKNRKFKKK